MDEMIFRIRQCMLEKSLTAQNPTIALSMALYTRFSGIKNPYTQKIIIYFVFIKSGIYERGEFAGTKGAKCVEHYGRIRKRIPFALLRTRADGSGSRWPEQTQ